MSDYGEFCRDMREGRRDLRRRLGRDCPHCNDIQPKRIPTILLPGQKCKVCGYRDPRKHTGLGPGGSVRKRDEDAALADDANREMFGDETAELMDLGILSPDIGNK